MDGKNKPDELPMMPLNGDSKMIDKEPPKTPENVKNHWIDCVSRVAFPVIYFSFIIFYWIYYLNHPDSALSNKVQE